MSEKFVVYKRLSKEKVEGNQYGFGSQDHDIQCFLKQIPGAEVIAEFSETYSGKSIWTERKELVKAVKLCEETGAILLVSKVDRLGRQVESVSHLLNRINVRIATMPSATNMVIQIMSVMAEEEARAISSRTKAALSVAKSKGVLIGAAVHRNKSSKVFGQRLAKSATNFAEQYKEKLDTMRSIGLTYAQIADNFNKKGIKARNGGEYSPIQVQRMCKRLGIV